MHGSFSKRVDACLQAAPSIKFSDETPAQRAKHREIAQEYERKRRKQRGPKTYRRICELEIIFVDRYGAVLPDDDAGLDDIFVMANHLAHLDAPDRRITAWVRDWAPWYGEERTAELIKAVLRKPLKWTADKLAQRLGLDYAARTRLGITTIGATDCMKAKREKRRRQQDAARHKALRAKAGARPHAHSVTQTQPWKAEGISRRTWYRRRNGTIGTDSSAACPKGMTVVTKQCHPTGAQPPLKGGALARAVPAVSAGETGINTDRGASGENLTVAARERESKPETPLKASSINMRSAAKSCNAAQQAREVFSRPKMQIIKQEEIAVMMKKPEAGFTMPPDVPNYFEALMWQYRRRDNRPAAREALQRALDESDDPAQTRCLLMDAVVKLREEPRPDDIVTLAEFIIAGSWRAENLEFNAAAAAAVESAKLVPLFRDRRVG
jgi:hypothetical protein